MRFPDPVNSEARDLYPSESRDGRYLFFTSNRPKDREITSAPGIREELGLTPSTERPDIDIYWVDAAFIERFRPGSK